MKVGEIVAKPRNAEFPERDSLRILDLLENPPEPNPRLLAATQALPGRNEGSAS